jgi:hypothetical protein
VSSSGLPSRKPALLSLPLLVSFRCLLGLQVLTDHSVWLQYKLGYVALLAVDAVVVVWLLYRIRGPFKAGAKPSVLGVWGWFWRAVAVGFCRVVLLFPFAYLVSYRRTPTEQSAMELLLLALPMSVAAAVVAWLFFSPNKTEQVQHVISSMRKHLGQMPNPSVKATCLRQAPYVER